MASLIPKQHTDKNMYHFIFFPKNLQRGCKILYPCRRQAALGKTKRVEKVSDDADAVFEEKENLPQPLRYLPPTPPKEGSANCLQT